MKQCTKCKKILHESCFNKDNRSKSGLASSCKNCRKNYYYINRDKILDKQKEYLNNEDVKKRKKLYREKNKEKIKKSWKKYYEKHKDKLRENRRKRHHENKDEENKKARIRSKNYYYINKDKILDNQKEIRKTEKYKHIHKICNKNWRENNVGYFVNWRKRNPGYDKRYSKTDSGMAARKRARKQRKAIRRDLKLIPLLVINNFPVVCQDHHVHDWFIVTLPYITHTSIGGYNRDKHRRLANDWIKMLYCLDMDVLLSGNL